ncbi:hypothetical protein EAX61_13885 [Dokdonia sinensis]|uniref:Uncharacterized protein n=1 Tax=Dokdonia sinensis TaxID=2479847 RepID=A0A3M0G5W6_9FLAO|nr:hypothetical protein EAX61_13885 [Dokdonia sinensis]
MSISQLILLSFSTIALCISYNLSRKKTKIKVQHEELVKRSIAKIQQHKRQIAQRNDHLSKYHLLKYNLDEALIPQHEIIL